MTHEPKSIAEAPDSAAIFAAALSLWLECKKRTSRKGALNLSECYNGMDQFMREVMRIANYFEQWSCKRVNFSELSEVWPYFLEDKFGEACLTVVDPSALAEFDDADCLQIAHKLQLPVIY